MLASRRCFLESVVATGCFARSIRGEQDDLDRRIDAARPSHRIPADLPDRLGATHTGGMYHLTEKPFLVEGAEALIRLGTRLAKFWFHPAGVQSNYPWNTQWPTCDDFIALARTDGFRAAFDLPFTTIALEAVDPVPELWRDTDPKAPENLDAVERHIFDLARHLYEAYKKRNLTFIIQNWEGDWRLRGSYADVWRPKPEEAEAVCNRMARWLAARQRGVERARREFGGHARCRVVHAAEVNRVFDATRGVPTVTRDVLPRVEVDLVSYSSYDGLESPRKLAEGLQQIRDHARTGPVFGPGALMIGEIGLPENEQPNGIADRWDGYVAAALAMDVRYIIQWELYCNEPRPGVKREGKPLDNSQLRGFYLLRPDGSTSATGKLFQEWWRRAKA